MPPTHEPSMVHEVDRGRCFSGCWEGSAVPGYKLATSIPSRHPSPPLCCFSASPSPRRRYRSSQLIAAARTSNPEAQEAHTWVVVICRDPVDPWNHPLIVVLLCRSLPATTTLMGRAESAAGRVPRRSKLNLLR